jgi:hypothetical protein
MLISTKYRPEVRLRAKGKKHQALVDTARAKIGFTNIKRIMRSCLKCEKEFESHGSGNRMCPKCGQYFNRDRYPDHHI